MSWRDFSLSNKRDFLSNNIILKKRVFLRVQQSRKEGGGTQNLRTSQLCTEGNLLAVSLEAGVGYGSLVLTTALLVSVPAGDLQVWCPHTQESSNALVHSRR